MVADALRTVASSLRGLWRDSTACLPSRVDGVGSSGGDHFEALEDVVIACLYSPHRCTLIQVVSRQ